MNIQDSFPLGLAGWISLKSKGSQESFPTPQFKTINCSSLSFLYSPALHPYMITGKTIALIRRTFVGKVMSLLFNMLSRLVIAFLPSSKCLSISWLQSPSAEILEPKNIKSLSVSIFSPSICQEVMGLDVMILVFWTLSFKPAFSLSSRGSLILCCFLPLAWYHLHIWGCWYSSHQSWFSFCNSSSLTFHMMHSAQKLNKQGDNILLSQFWTSQLFHVQF